MHIRTVCMHGIHPMCYIYFSSSEWCIIVLYILALFISSILFISRNKLFYFDNSLLLCCVQCNPHYSTCCLLACLLAGDTFYIKFYMVMGLFSDFAWFAFVFYVFFSSFLSIHTPLKYNVRLYFDAPLSASTLHF